MAMETMKAIYRLGDLWSASSSSLVSLVGRSSCSASVSMNLTSSSSSSLLLSWSVLSSAGKSLFCSSSSVLDSVSSGSLKVSSSSSSSLGMANTAIVGAVYTCWSFAGDLVVGGVGLSSSTEALSVSVSAVSAIGDGNSSGASSATLS